MTVQSAALLFLVAYVVIGVTISETWSEESKLMKVEQRLVAVVVAAIGAIGVTWLGIYLGGGLIVSE
jgi:hypothetical protein